MKMPSMCFTSFSTAASRASVSRLPSPASTRRRVRSVSSNVMLPELPDANMETRKPIVDSCQKTLTQNLNRDTKNKFSASSQTAGASSTVALLKLWESLPRQTSLAPSLAELAAFTGTRHLQLLSFQNVVQLPRPYGFSQVSVHSPSQAFLPVTFHGMGCQRNHW